MEAVAVFTVVRYDPPCSAILPTPSEMITLSLAKVPCVAAGRRKPTVGVQLHNDYVLTTSTNRSRRQTAVFDTILR